MMSKIALTSGKDRYQNIREALDLIKDELVLKIKNKRRILIKPNFVHDTRQLAATHVDGVRALLDFLEEIALPQKITIGEASYRSTERAFKNFGYLELEQGYNVELLDLNKDETEEIEIYDKNFKPVSVQVSRTVLKSDFRISITPPKTHDEAVVTLGIKNLAVGAVVTHSKQEKHWRGQIHQGYTALNLNIAKLAQAIPPHLCIIDGFLGMEGEGPSAGEPVETRWAIAGTDYVGVDSLGAYLMGVNPEEVGYIYYLAKGGTGKSRITRLNILGENPEKLKRKFKLHPTYLEQLKWKGQ